MAADLAPVADWRQTLLAVQEVLLSTPGGQAYPEAELRRWMEEAGCPPGDVVEAAADEHFLLLGRRAG